MTGLNVVHVDQALTQISVAYRNPAFVAEELFPVVPVQKQNDLFFRFSKQHFKVENDSYRPGTHATRLEVDLDNRGSYRCDGHALELPIPDELRENADPGAQLEVEFTEKLTQAILLAEENNTQGKISTTNIPQNTTLSGTSQWSDYVNSDPVPTVESAKETIQQATGALPNRLFLPRPVFRTLRNHPRIIDRVKYTGTGARRQLTPEDLADVFDVEKVVVPAALKQTVNRGQADSLTYIWGKIALLYYTPDKPSLRTPAFGYAFLWVGLGAAYQVKRWREEGEDSEIIKVKKYYDLKIVEPNVAYLWQNAIA